MLLGGLLNFLAASALYALWLLFIALVICAFAKLFANGIAYRMTREPPEAFGDWPVIPQEMTADGETDAGGMGNHAPPADYAQETLRTHLGGVE